MPTVGKCIGLVAAAGWREGTPFKATNEEGKAGRLIHLFIGPSVMLVFDIENLRNTRDKCTVFPGTNYNYFLLITEYSPFILLFYSHTVHVARHDWQSTHSTVHYYTYRQTSLMPSCSHGCLPPTLPPPASEVQDLPPPHTSLFAANHQPWPWTIFAWSTAS